MIKQTDLQSSTNIGIVNIFGKLSSSVVLFESSESSCVGCHCCWPFLCGDWCCWTCSERFLNRFWNFKILIFFEIENYNFRYLHHFCPKLVDIDGVWHRNDRFLPLHRENREMRPFLSCQTCFSASIYLFATFLEASLIIKKNYYRECLRYDSLTVGSPGIGPLIASPP